jgi:photosystem II stability/assembly factor-like uncharacterized protein
MYFASHTGCASGLPMSRSRSTDGGATWAEMPGEGMSFAAADENIAYATTCTGLIKTTDSGQTWTPLNTPQLSSDPISLAAGPDGQTVYVAFVSEGGTGQIWTSADGGATWKEVTPTENVDPNEGFRAPDDLAFVTGTVGRPDDGGLYLSNDQGVWHLSIDGSEWTFMPKPPIEGVPAGGYDYHTAFLVDTAYSAEYDKAGPILYTARGRTDDNGNSVNLGVWRSTNMGASWQQVGKGLENVTVNNLSLAIAEGTTPGNGRVETLLAATDDGIWALPTK